MKIINNSKTQAANIPVAPNIPTCHIAFVNHSRATDPENPHSDHPNLNLSAVLDKFESVLDKEN